MTCAVESTAERHIRRVSDRLPILESVCRQINICRQYHRGIFRCNGAAVDFRGIIPQFCRCTDLINGLHTENPIKLCRAVFFHKHLLNRCIAIHFCPNATFCTPCSGVRSVFVCRRRIGVEQGRHLGSCVAARIHKVNDRAGRVICESSLYAAIQRSKIRRIQPDIAAVSGYDFIVVFAYPVAARPVDCASDCRVAILHLGAAAMSGKQTAQ